MGGNFFAATSSLKLAAVESTKAYDALADLVARSRSWDEEVDWSRGAVYHFQIKSCPRGTHAVRGQYEKGGNTK